MSNKKFIEALKAKGVPNAVIASAIADMSKPKVVITRKLAKLIESKLERIGDKCVLTLKRSGIKVLTMNGYKNLTKNAKTAREVKRNGNARATG